MKELFFRRLMKFMNFSFVGLTAFAMHVFLTVLLTEAFHITYYLSYAVSLVLAWFANFMFNLKFTFDAKGEMSKRIKRFVLIAVAFSLLNWLMVVGAVELLKLHYLLAIVIVSILLSILTFRTSELWVFGLLRPARISHHKKK